jgi:Ni/Fe-hydrogenase subunit HybB-like protein
MNRKEKIPFFTTGTKIVTLIFLVGAAATVYRMFAGLGAATHLSDEYPWGIWVAMDILVGVALAAGGFTITFLVYVFNLKEFKPVARPGVLTAFLGYLMVICGEIVDIGKPLVFWHPLVMWQYHSVLFEVVICIALYTSVLTLEFGPAVLDRFGLARLAGLLKRKMVVFALVIAGITLSFHHQASLGGLYLMVPDKLHPLWYSPKMPFLFFLSAVAAGLAMVSFQSIVSSWALNRGYETEILRGLARWTSGALLVYLVVRLGDIAYRGKLPYLLDGSGASHLFWVEIGAGVILPMVLLFLARNASANGIFPGQLLVILGLVLNRFDTNFLSQVPHGGTYFPSWMEIAFSLGLIALAVLLYRLAVLNLEVFTPVQEET